MFKNVSENASPISSICQRKSYRPHMTQLYLIRHGEALGAVQKIIGNTSLSPLGITQAERLRDRLAATGEIAANILISSTLKRARETAEIIAPALGLPIIYDDDIQELRDGASDGMKEDEYAAAYGRVNFMETPFRPVAPGGEGWGQFILRVCSAFDRILREYEGKTIVLVCHGGVIGISFLYFLGFDTLHYPQSGFDTHNTSITHWKRFPFSRDASRYRWRLQCYNDDMHLRDLFSPVRIPWKALSLHAVEGADQPLTSLDEAR
jgi:probable phosphoglycerate mutase